MASQTPFSKMLDIEVVGGDQRQRLAEMLRANALNAPQGQMVSGWYVPPSWSQNLAHLANTAVGVFGGQAIDEENRRTMQEDYQKFISGQNPQKVAAAVRSQGTPEQEATTPAYPSTPAAGRVEGGEFKAMKVANVEGMPSYGMTPQTQQQAAPQPQQFDRYDPNQYSNPQFRNAIMRSNIERVMAVPEYSQTPQYDQQGRAFVLDKQGNMKYLGSDQSPIRKADYNELIQIDPTTGKPTINPLALQAKSLVSRAGAANVSVNTGQRGFDNTLKLRSDFRSEPIYKGFQEVKGAFDQVREAAKLASPAGDLAAATKVMKILDPGSVVRESELGLALSASGLGDRISNYANMIVTGQKLTPAQRKDFVNLSEQLYNASANQYNAKRGEYVGIAERNQLNVPDVVGESAKVQKQVVRTGMMNGKKVVEYNDGTVEYAR